MSTHSGHRLTSGGRITRIPLEVYVARVLAGEGEPNAPDAARQALAVAIRTYTLVQMGRHRREGFDLCDTVHCQVLRAANDNSRRAALATAHRVLTVNGAPAEVFYSASCGGRSEGAAQVWPGATFPYMQVVRDDDVHEEDVPWTLELTIDRTEECAVVCGVRRRPLAFDRDRRSQSVGQSRAVARAGDASRRNYRSRVSRRARNDEDSQHGVHALAPGEGCSIHRSRIRAWRRHVRDRRRPSRASRESLEAILAQYYPNLQLTDLATASVSPKPVPPPPIAVSASGVVVLVPRDSKVSARELERMTVNARESLTRALGTPAVPVTVELHDTLDQFRLEVRRPWWVSAAVTGSTIDLAPAALLAQREGIEATVRTAMAELLMSATLADRPAWVRVGGARYFASASRPETPSCQRLVSSRCGADARAVCRRAA